MDGTNTAEDGFAAGFCGVCSVQEKSVRPGSPAVTAGKNSGPVVELQFIIGQLMNPGGPGDSLSAWSPAVVLRKETSLPGICFVPVMPAIGMNVAVHIAVQENRFGKFPPWPSKVYGARRTIA